MQIISHGYYEQPEYIVEISDVDEAVDLFNRENDGYTAELVKFTNDEDYTITITHEDADGTTSPNGVVFDISQLEDWTTAYAAHTAAATLDENGNVPRFNPTLDDGDIVK